MNIFDIIGPIMIGPSSSHTAGAARIGRAAARLLDDEPVKAKITLSGSFMRTYQGHGTDKALIAGILDMPVDDLRIRDSFEIAQKKGFEYEFILEDIPDAHPNTALIALEGKNGGCVTMRACSVGGGAIRVEELNGLAVSFTGAMDTLVISHTDAPGVIANVSSLIAGLGVNIATMQVFRRNAGGDAVMVIETDHAPDNDSVRMIRRLRGIRTANLLLKL
ncbi:MAG: L-serine ammonia-lyase, iron-sulfur-dependent subunit beta [Clostridia bacterium]|nr:L-serine ammonia-lyase, iron-sulfur-dependent subunit beta [Clostridia bacterium]